MCVMYFRPKRNKDDPIDQLKHFFGGEKGFSEKQHNNHVSF